MPQVGSYKQGTPCWADLQTRDVEAANAFYGQVFGWTFEDLPTPDGRSYAKAFVDGDLVSVIAPYNTQQETAGAQAQWNIYFAAADARAVAEDTVHAGARVLFGPEAVEDTGVMLFVEVPAGGTTGFWQPGTHYGAARFNEPGALAWAELLTSEPAAAVGFFQQLFGHEVTEYPQDDGGSYSTLVVDGEEVAGIVPAAEGEEGWQIYFGVADVAEAVAAAVSAGGEVLVEPDEDVDAGTLATIMDPQGGVLSLIQI
ncbi:VOC family protein [Arthrobacter cavernae]|uniref:VOC family protein n=1 Tax=Arthrobacter cavernae TaxID=2817681 RepID=A0A939KN48_9MICC|nr:VOC family protein [Arthrobacter cavernae]MBO1268906.1 VOC family protein [Arthrobacter cavernae]